MTCWNSRRSVCAPTCPSACMSHRGSAPRMTAINKHRCIIVGTARHRCRQVGASGIKRGRQPPCRRRTPPEPMHPASASVVFSPKVCKRHGLLLCCYLFTSFLLRLRSLLHRRQFSQFRHLTKERCLQPLWLFGIDSLSPFPGGTAFVPDFQPLLGAETKWSSRIDERARGHCAGDGVEEAVVIGGRTPRGRGF